jgi:hypothetical protein
MASLDIVDERNTSTEELDPAEAAVLLAVAYQLAGNPSQAQQTLKRAQPYAALSPVSAKWVEAAALALDGKKPTAQLLWLEANGHRRVHQLWQRLLTALAAAAEAMETSTRLG